MSNAVPIVRGDGEGERLWFTGGGVWTMKATAEETDGAFTLLEDRLVRGKTTPLHIHPNLDETLIVLEGEILVHAEGTEHRLGPRGVAVAPRGLPHAFMVTSETARILALQTPGSGEAFYRDATEQANAETDPGRSPTSIACGRLRSATPTLYRCSGRPRSRRQRSLLRGPKRADGAEAHSGSPACHPPKDYGCNHFSADFCSG
jgi:quercetin dioxygenase-like cupin family protein